MKCYIEVLGKLIEITEQEYDDYVIEDVVDLGGTKKEAREVISSHKKLAQIRGTDEMWLQPGYSVIIKGE